MLFTIYNIRIMSGLSQILYRVPFIGGRQCICKVEWEVNRENTLFLFFL